MNKSFEEYVKDLAGYDYRQESPEALAHLDYSQELDIKNRAFALYLKDNDIKAPVQDLVASPKPRYYRTTTKRRVYFTGSQLGLGFAQPVSGCPQSLLEPQEHFELYQFLYKTLLMKAYSSLTRALNWLIIRGDYQRRFVIFNVYKMDGDVVRKLKKICDLLNQEKLAFGAMSYFDPSRSGYYLEVEKPAGAMQTKHLFGPRLLGLKVDETLMRYSPLGFSQVNESMVPLMLDEAKNMLKAQSSDTLLDLYCGYGLFSHTLGSLCQRVIGVELSSLAIESAKEIAKRSKTQNKMSFHSERIDAHLLKNKFEPTKKPELILLDPPRKGCEPGVIALLAKRKPKRVVQIFCGTDVVPKEIKEWQKQGYEPRRIQALDMFAGTANLETMVLFTAK